MKIRVLARIDHALGWTEVHREGVRSALRLWVGAIAGVTILSAGPSWTQAATNTWDGSGDLNSDGNWSVANNWDPDSAPNGATDVAILAAPTTRHRTVTVDGAVTVQKIQMGYGGYQNTLSLNADLDVGQFTYAGASYMNYRVVMNGRKLTLGAGNLTSSQVPDLSGTGTFVKTGTGTATLIYDGWSGFTGTYRVDDGVLYGTYARISGSSEVRVNSGATYYVNAAAGEQPKITINGSGFGGQGAFRAANYTYTGTLTLPTDASVSVDASQTLTFSGTLAGPGRLTKDGTGKLLIAVNCNGYATNVIVQAGTLEVSGLLQNAAITVKSGATLKAPAYRVGAVTVESGGTWDSTASPDWIKGSNYDGNDNGNWSEASNWGSQAVPTNNAILGTVTGNGSDGSATRTVTNDVPWAVGTLSFVQANGSYQNRIYLAADMTVGTLTLTPASWNLYGIEIPSNRTFTVTNSTPNGFPYLYPQAGTAGTVIKEGPGGASLIYSPGFNWYGTYIARGGVTHLNYDRINYVALVVEQGGTLRIDGTTENNSGSISIKGTGYNNGGALWVSGTHSMGNRGITVASNALMKIDSTFTLTLGRPLAGAGTLDLIGGGTLDLNSTWAFSVAGAAANGIAARTGTVDIAGCTLSISNLAAATALEYVVVDYNWPNGVVVGQFAATNGLIGDWFLTRTGTKSHPNAVVLARPPPAGVLLMLR